MADIEKIEVLGSDVTTLLNASGLLNDNVS